MKITLTREQFIKKTYEEIIFNEVKDKFYVTAPILRAMYPEYEGIVDFSNIYKKIVEYRIKTYGTSSTSYMSLKRYEELVGRNNIL